MQRTVLVRPRVFQQPGAVGRGRVPGLETVKNLASGGSLLAGRESEQAFERRNGGAMGNSREEVVRVTEAEKLGGREC